MLRILRNLMNEKRQNKMPSCKECGEEYTDVVRKWCKPCQINDLKTNWTSGNKKIDNLIQEMQLKIDSHDDLVFEFVGTGNQMIEILLRWHFKIVKTKQR